MSQSSSPPRPPTGRPSPSRLPELEDEAFRELDGEAKAYLLGWLATVPTLTTGVVSVSLELGDTELFGMLQDALHRRLPLKRQGREMRLELGNEAMVYDMCWHLGLKAGKRGQPKLPDFDTQGLGWAFLRGLFDRDGRITRVDGGVDEPRCQLALDSDALREGLRELCGDGCSDGGGTLSWRGSDALDFMARLYDDADVALPSHVDAYQRWAMHVPPFTGGDGEQPPRLRWARLDPAAVAPFKERASDSGYDLTLIREVKRIGNVTMFGTGVLIEPDYGWYFEVVPRSSIIKTGYMLANSVGVIDRAYRGEILVPLIKVDPKAKDLNLPKRLVQLIPRPVVHMTVEEADQLRDTGRGPGGFGSTG
jgi:deoxyuridine 5'-triphosphate nucleotidohydrolase